MRFSKKAKMGKRGENGLRKVLLVSCAYHYPSLQHIFFQLGTHAFLHHVLVRSVSFKIFGMKCQLKPSIDVERNLWSTEVHWDLLGWGLLGSLYLLGSNGSSRIYRDIFRSAWVYWGLLGSTWVYWRLLWLIEVHWDLLGHPWANLVLLGSTKVSCDLLGSTRVFRVCWGPLGSNRVSWG